MTKPATAQQLIDLIERYFSPFHRATVGQETAEEILVACKALLEALEEKP